MTGTVLIQVLEERVLLSLSSITVTPVNPSVPAGVTEQFTATGNYTDGTTKNLTTQVTWASATKSVATISNAGGSQGLATSVAMGTSNVSATLGGISGSTVFTVSAAQLMSIAVTPATKSIAAGLTQQFTATGTYTDNSTKVLTTQATWSSDTKSVATVSNASGSQGLATGVAVGTASISAALSGVTGSATLHVSAANLVSIAVTPNNPVVPTQTTQQFVATGTYSDNSTQVLTTQVAWASSLTSIASISNDSGSQGLATALNKGTTTISATLGSVSGSTVLTVSTAVLQSIAVTPSNPTVSAGATQQFIATGTYSDSSTKILTSQVTWASATTSVATISNASGSQGLATGVATGSSTISATLGSVVGSTLLTVGVALKSIAVTPASPTIAQGTTEQFIATGTYSDNSTRT